MTYSGQLSSRQLPVGAESSRQLPVGAEVDPDGGVQFRVWAPAHERVEILFPDGRPSRGMGRERDGYFAVHAPDAQAGTATSSGWETTRPRTPTASRFQPEGPHGPSEVVDPHAFAWTDQEWHGVTIASQVLYELHIGTFTAESTYAAAARRFEHLRHLGVTCIEVMPVADFPGEFLDQFPSIHDPAMRAQLAGPSDEDTFMRCRLDWTECERHAPVLSLYRDLLRLRRTEGAFASQTYRGVDGAVLGPEAFVLRFFDGAPGTDPDPAARCGDRLLLVNLGADLRLESVPEPLLAPPPASRWTVRWSSEGPQYGGGGTPPVESPDGEWCLPGHAAIVMSTVPGGHVRRAHKRRTA